MKKLLLLSLLLSFSLSSIFAKHDKNGKKGDTIAAVVSGLKFRNIGPALTSGRIADFAFDEENPSRWFVAVAGGGVWSTTDNGTTFNPIFDTYGSYSTSCILIDPNNPNILWLGTGENNAQRSLAYGDGVYKSIDGGKSWKNMGLKTSRQIGDIVIDPRDSKIVYVAAEGSVWGAGGDRGLYKTIDGGETWKKILEISENSGAKNIAMDMKNPDVLYVSSSQRRRHVNIRIGGGPDVSIYKTEDGGKSFRKINKGLPTTQKGGIDIAISPQNHNIVYAIVEAAEGKGGFYRSSDRGETWNKMSDHNTSGQYFCEIYCDPVQFDKIYSVDTYSKYSIDGGKTWKNISTKDRHVDDHAIWIDKRDTKHFYIGGDGGIYETFNAGNTFLFKTNLPVTQFYKIALDYEKPFYNVYGGTQDNNSQGGPIRSIYKDGVTNCEWTITLGGDGFFQAVEEDNPDIVYSAYQYGNIYRFDKKSGEKIALKPVAPKGENHYKWNWNTPFILSSHSPTRLYLAANKVFKSDDRGNTWQIISGEISHNLPRDKWPVMGQYWSVDGSVAKNVSTSLYGMAVEIAESPIKEGLLYVGTDDGILQISENDGKTWTKIEDFPGVPKYTYVADIIPSKFDENTVFIALENHKRDDYKPYILKSTDKGKSWQSITGDLPENEVVRAIEQDYVNKNLLFAGTEKGLFFTLNGGKQWTKMTSGLPTIAIRDIKIQKEENDLVLASFGRGIFILDDYTPLRLMTKEIKEKNAYLFPIKDALLYMPRNRGGFGSGAQIYHAKNPDFGAIFTFYQKDAPKTAQQIRREKEKKLFKNKAPIPIPTPKELEAEKNEIPPYLLIKIKDIQGNTIRKITKSSSKGLRRFNWDLRIEAPWGSDVKKFKPLKNGGSTYLALPGKYTISIDQYSKGKFENLIEKQEFNVIPLNLTTLAADNREDLFTFETEVISILKEINAAENSVGELHKQIASMQQVCIKSPKVPNALLLQLEETSKELNDIEWAFNGEKPRASAEERIPAEPTISDRTDVMGFANWESLSNITQTQKDNLTILKEVFPPIQERIRKIKEEKIPYYSNELKRYKAVWSPNR